MTSFTDTNVTAGQSYDYSVVAFDAARNYTVLSKSDSAAAGSGSTGAAPRSSGGGESLSAPSGLRAEAQGSDRVSLAWNAASGDVAGYNVYRDGSYQTTVRGTAWTDGGLAADSEYQYDVVAFSNDAKFSSHSNKVSVRTGGGGNGAQPASTPAPQADSSGSTRSGGSNVPAGYRLAFAEEFNGNGIDSDKWNTRYLWGPNWTINNEQQYYVDTNSNPDFGYDPFVFDGKHLSITADRTPGYLKASANNKSYVSGTLTTYNKFKMRYGYVEMRAKMPKGQGLWPALWLLHHKQNGARPEIDIMEFLGNDVDTVYNVYHHYRGSNLRSTPSYEVNGPDYTAGFHTFGVKWEPGSIVWYVDGKEANRYESGDVSNEDMYILVNLALGGAWGGNVDGSTPFPARYTIDYVRAYTR